MRRQHNGFHLSLVFLGAATLLASAGCRSMPGRNWFGFRAGPSAEMLAGSGPSATYPAPPSTMATPEAIASVAGGTAPAANDGTAPGSPTTAQVAATEAPPGFATPAAATSPQTNPAAAQANGFYATGTPGGPPPDAESPSNYAFGSKALTPRAAAGGVDPAPAPPSSFATQSSYNPVIGELKTPSTSVTPPPASSYPAPEFPTATAGGAVASPATSTGGYTLPTDAAAMAALASANFSGEASPEPPSADPESAAESAAGPDFSTASAAVSEGAAIPAGNRPAAATPEGYRPGSTSTDHGYPMGDLEPATSGSFYR